jgi:hypothetical protein
MKHPSNYSITTELKKRVPMLIALMILAALIALNVAVPEPVLEPDSVYPMANSRIGWEQTYHAGAWSGEK